MVPVAQQFVLSMAGALALKEALCRYADGFTPKWPNDIYWQNRKISGTLIETSVSGHAEPLHFRFGNKHQSAGIPQRAPNPVSLCHIIGRETPPRKRCSHSAASLRKVLCYGDGRALRRGGTPLPCVASHRRDGMHEYHDAGGRPWHASTKWGLTAVCICRCPTAVAAHTLSKRWRSCAGRMMKRQ